MSLRQLHTRLLRRLPRQEPLFTGSIDVAGKTFLVPKINGSMCGVSEPWMVELLARLLPARSGTFCDCGVNIGQTLLAVKAADPERSYIGFEPNSECVAYVEKLVAVNRLSNVQIVPVGLAEAPGIRKLQLYHGTTSDPSASLVQDFRPGEAVSRIKLVPVMAFADIEAQLGVSELGIVKIDVEGAEAEVIGSMRGALVTFEPWLIVEILPCYSDTNVARFVRQREIENIMRTADYAMFRLTKTSSGTLQGATELDEIGVHSSLDLSDYIFCPRKEIPVLRDCLPVLDSQVERTRS